MCRQSFKLRKHRKLFLALLLSGLLDGVALALSIDKEQDIEIEADTAEMDDADSTVVYHGDVILKQGSIRLTGDVLWIYFGDNDDVKLAVMDGQPATYRELSDDRDGYEEAKALKIEYNMPENLIILTDEAWVKRPDGSTMTADHIEYNTELRRVKVNSANETVDTEAGKEKKDGRVKILIKNKKAPGT